MGKWRWTRAVIPFALIAALGVLRGAAGAGWGVLPLLAVGPALAAAVSGPALTLAAGAEALGICGLYLATERLDAHAYHHALIACLAVAGVAAGASLASGARARRDRALARVRLVADAAQLVVMRPIPREAGPVTIAARYLSAAEDARVGGDLAEVESVAGCVRIVVGDAEGKGLQALQSAATVLSVFREAAHEEKDLHAIASRIETSLARRLGEEEFVTAVFAEISADGSAVDLLCCGHPAPLTIRGGQVRPAECARQGLPLGLGHLTGEARVTTTVPFGEGERLLFYTDGIAEARNGAGEFFPLAESAALRSPLPPEAVLDRLCREMARHTRRAPADDVALLLVCRDGR
jgi:serine phosphatase RsbU (regulator of sigma subunit)